MQRGLVCQRRLRVVREFAACDVFAVEPLPPEHPLWRMENVIVTPHTAAASPRVAERHLETLLDNLRRFVKGEPVVNVVDKTAWY